jgi:hypothetical protein
MVVKMAARTTAVHTIITAMVNFSTAMVLSLRLSSATCHAAGVSPLSGAEVYDRTGLSIRCTPVIAPSINMSWYRFRATLR